MVTFSQATLTKVKRHDRMARWVVTLGGVVVIVCVLGILLMILGTTLPLFLPARARLLAHVNLPPTVKADAVLAIGIDVASDYSRQTAHILDASGTFHFVDLFSGEVIQDAKTRPSSGTVPTATPKVSEPSSQPTVLAAVRSSPAAYTLRWSDGSISLAEVVLPSLSDKASERPKFLLKNRANVPPDKFGVPREAILYATGDKSSVCAAVYSHDRIVITRQSATEDLSGDETTNAARIVIADTLPGPLTAIALDRSGTMLYAGTANGSLLWWRLGEDRVLDHDILPAFLDKRAVTSLSLMLGDVTLVVGDASGEVSNWFFVVPESERKSSAAERRTASSKKELKKLALIRTLAPHVAAIREIVASPRNRELLIRDESGAATVDVTTSERRLAKFDHVDRLAFSSRGDTIIGLTGDEIKAWHIEGSFFGHESSLHPEVSWKTLLAPVWYEGLSEPEFAWQTTGGDDYEPKLSLIPMIFGTFKGTFYAMLLAGPLALSAAAYVSHFTTPQFRAWIKPAIEMMAALPSVVLGFLVGVWLAPVIRSGLVTLLLALVSVPVVFIIFLLIWEQVRKRPAAERQARSREFLLAALLLIVGVVVASWFSSPLEQRYFGGNVTTWMSKHLGVIYDQRNSILIAFGVGFTVIPMIFTLAEDALSSVPHGMTAASMALGASRWQTLWHVVLPSASPGIFAAIMIGFGRAVGETMIFLMATGSTPNMDLSPFNGMLTLSANIAQEIPGAPAGGTLYRMLFLCAVILFVLTFILNTIAEVVRQRLRKKYGQF